MRYKMVITYKGVFKIANVSCPGKTDLFSYKRIEIFRLNYVYISFYAIIMITFYEKVGNKRSFDFIFYKP